VLEKDTGFLIKKEEIGLLLYFFKMTEEKFDKIWEIVKELRRAQKIIRYCRELNVPDILDGKLQDSLNLLEETIRDL